MAAGTGRSTASRTSGRESFLSFAAFRSFGWKARDFELFAQAVDLLANEVVPDSDYRQVVLLREQMNRGGKRRYTAERILRDYTPSSPVDLTGEMR